MAKLMQISEAERKFLLMYFDEDELFVVSATRSLKSISRVAENVEVVTAEDIELMNAHTVAEALYNVVGINISAFAGPGNQGNVSIQGSEPTRVALFLDGVPLQTADNYFGTGIIPVQMIEKLEVIKGPASSAWGSSFGGVVNIITKSAIPGDRTRGTVYFSAGEQETSDAHAEMSVSGKNLGLYLYGGTMNSSGLVLDNGFWQNDFFTKLNVDAGARTKLDATFLYRSGNRRDWTGSAFGYDEVDNIITENYMGRVSLKSNISNAVDINASAWYLKFHDTANYKTISTGETFYSVFNQQEKYGFSANMTYRAGNHTVVAGTDMSEGKFKHTSFPPGTHKLSKYAFYVNDTINLGDFSFTPGIRYDHSTRGGESISPSIGMTYQASRNILLKASVSRGFFDPSISSFLSNNPSFVANSGLDPEHIWSYEVGGEANVADFLWAKLVLFRHDIEDLIAEKSLDDPLQPDLNTLVNAGKQRVYGGEFSVRTKEVKGFILSAGISYENIERLNFTDERAFDTTNMYDINASVRYNNGKGLRAILQNRYQWWNLPPYWEARYGSVITDFNIIKDVYKKQDMSLDIFLSGHNIFDGKSFENSWYPNPERWFEAGLRMKF
ncbi:MAG: TonB-dependent receptor [Thermodesulfovibrionales bacterium]